MKLHTNSARKIPTANSYISAGPAAEIYDDHTMLDINELITRGREGFGAYELTGDSADPDIRSGYIVFVDFWAEPRNGQFIAATINGLTCVKEFQNSPGGLYLVSKNAAYQPREVVATDSFHVLGVVRGHLALYR